MEMFLNLPVSIEFPHKFLIDSQLRGLRRQQQSPLSGTPYKPTPIFRKIHASITLFRHSDDIDPTMASSCERVLNGEHKFSDITERASLANQHEQVG